MQHSTRTPAAYAAGASPPDLCGRSDCCCGIAGILPAERSLPEWTHRERAFLALAANYALANRPLPLAVLRIVRPLRDSIIARLDALEPDSGGAA